MDEKQSYQRRDFIKRTGLGLAGLMMSPALAVPSKQSTVVHVRHSGAIGEDGTINQAIVDEMFAKGLTVLSGKNTLIDSWNTFILPQDRVSVKMNAINLRGIRDTPLVAHFSGVAQSIAEGLNAAGTRKEGIIFWDRTTKEMARTGLVPQYGDAGVRVMGTTSKNERENVGYEARSENVGEKKVHVSKILTRMTDSMINVSVLKNHLAAGITGSLKNHYGTIDNPTPFHWRNCTNPGIPEINLIPAIRNKQRLCVCDALLGAYSRGPYWRRNYIFKHGGLLFSTDPVALDRVCTGILNEKRIAEGKDPIRWKPGRDQMTLSSKMGLGVSDMSSIHLKEYNLG